VSNGSDGSWDTCLRSGGCHSSMSSVMSFRAKLDRLGRWLLNDD